MLMSVAPSLAQTLKTPECTPANIASTTEAIAKMADGKQKLLASEEIGAANQALTQGKEQECRDHLLKASLQTK